MRVKTILNRVQKFKSFVYESVRWSESDAEAALMVEAVARTNSHPLCSGCGLPGPGYDTLPPRTFEFIPLWGIAVFFVYALRRVDCRSCGVKVERVPWAEGKQTLCTAYMQFLAAWARRLSWQETAEVFRTSWDKVFRSVQWAVNWGLAHRDLSGVTAIGVDEVLWHRGHKYLTVVYQIDALLQAVAVGGKGSDGQNFAAFFPGVWPCTVCPIAGASVVICGSRT